MKGVIIYDDKCKLCQYSTAWLNGHVPSHTFNFEKLTSKKSKEWKQIWNQDIIAKDEVIYVTDNNVYFGWKAIEKILLSMNGVWYWIGKALLILPNGIKTIGYRVIARNRYKLQRKK